MKSSSERVRTIEQAAEILWLDDTLWFKHPFTGGEKHLQDTLRRILKVIKDDPEAFAEIVRYNGST